SVEVMKAMYHGLLMRRVRPYYLYQCDPISGSAHFRTPVSKGLEIIEGLRGHTTGYAVPHFVIDAPGGGGKIPLIPDYVVGREGEDMLFRNFEGGTYRCPVPGEAYGQRCGRPACESAGHTIFATITLAGACPRRRWLSSTAPRPSPPSKR